jgi:menaquinone-dependent protoporphyrinogen oxidase
VDLQPIREITSVNRYCAVVLGAALYIGRLHKDARRFLLAQHDALTSIPVALFVPGPVEKRVKDWAGAQQQLDMELARLPWLPLVSSQIVGGTFDPKRLCFPVNIIPPLRKLPARDARDWIAIRAWASDLSMTLQPALER